MDITHLETAVVAAIISFLHVRFWHVLIVPVHALLGKLEEQVVEKMAEQGVDGFWKRLRKWMSRNHSKQQKPERKQMAKKIVKFTCVDAPKPKKMEGMVGLGAPLDLVLEDGREFTLDLGFKCDRPLLLISSRVMEVVGEPFVQAGRQPKVQVRAKISTMINRGERIFYAVPLALVDFDLE